MKWTISKTELEGAISIVNNVPPRNGIKASEFIQIARSGKDSVSFSLTSDVMSKAIVRIGNRFPSKHPIFLDRRMFIPFVDMGRESKNPIYKFILKDGNISVTHGGRNAVYSKASVITGYEDVPSIVDIKTSSLDKQWIELVDAAKQCATDDPVTPQFNCVYLRPTSKRLEIYAANGRVVFRGTADKTKRLKETIAFPLMLVDSLLIEHAQKLMWTAKFAMISFPKGKIWQAVKVAARKNFPIEEASKLIKASREDDVVMMLPATTMSSVADRIASYVAALSRESLVLKIILEKGAKVASVESGSDTSKFQETVHLSKPAPRTLTIEWPLDCVMPILLYCKEDGMMKIRISKEERTCITTDTVTLAIARPEHKAKKKNVQ